VQSTAVIQSAPTDWCALHIAVQDSGSYGSIGVESAVQQYYSVLLHHISRSGRQRFNKEIVLATPQKIQLPQQFFSSCSSSPFS
jgi:hypothetical protein